HGPFAVLADDVMEHGREIVEARLECHGASVYRNRGAIGLALLRAATARWRPMRWTLGLAAAAALVVAASACGSTITVPDQGIIVSGCQLPAQCFSTICSCARADVESGQCTQNVVCSDPTNLSTCDCPTHIASDGGGFFDSLCIEQAQTCVGR